MLPKEYFEKYLIHSPLVESVSCFDIIGIGHECPIYDSILFYEKKESRFYSFQNVITKNACFQNVITQVQKTG